MRLWTYERPFQHKDTNYEVKFFFSFTAYTSQLYCNGSLVDEHTCRFSEGAKATAHKLQAKDQNDELTVCVGYYNWLSVGIEVHENDALIYASHPSEDIYFAEKKLGSLESESEAVEADKAVEKAQYSQKWQQNKHSIFADIALGVAFFILAKVTGDLRIAAFTGVALGLGLVVIQRFVKVDLLGGFAIFGTIMLLISALFSLAFQSEYLVQLNGTFMGLLGASILLADGIFRQGRYFGARFEPYLSSPIKHQHFVIGLGVISACMSGVNYGVATYLSEDVWLNYKTFYDTVIYIVLFLLLTRLASAKH